VTGRLMRLLASGLMLHAASGCHGASAGAWRARCAAVWQPAEDPQAGHVWSRRQRPSARSDASSSTSLRTHRV